VRNEKLTRKEIIDNRLKQAGWNVTDRTQVIEEFDIHLTVVEEPTTPYAGHQYSDYVLLGKDEFVQIIQKTEALKTQYQQSLQELENLYGSLSQKAFRGELSLKYTVNQ
jgi:type I site-specific restriction endonuclease